MDPGPHLVTSQYLPHTIQRSSWDHPSGLDPGPSQGSHPRSFPLVHPRPIPWQVLPRMLWGWCGALPRKGTSGLPRPIPKGHILGPSHKCIPGPSRGRPFPGCCGGGVGPFPGREPVAFPGPSPTGASQAHPHSARPVCIPAGPFPWRAIVLATPAN
jgi:hypothetical protein